MKKKKLRVGILFGGRSGEHEISLLSANSILKAIDRTRYDVVPIGIDKRGHWHSGLEAQRLLSSGAHLPPSLTGSTKDDAADLDAEFAAAAAVLRSGEPLRIPSLPSHPHLPETLELNAGAELAHPVNPLSAAIDVIFPILHGTFGEDGTIQAVSYTHLGKIGRASCRERV